MNCEVRRHFFSERVVNRWNMLDQDTVSAKSVNGFKSKLESERKRKMGLFLTEVCWASIVAIFHLWSGRTCELPVSVCSVISYHVIVSQSSLDRVSCRQMSDVNRACMSASAGTCSSCQCVPRSFWHAYLDDFVWSRIIGYYYLLGTCCHSNI